MIDNSKENIPNRKKVNYKNYKDLCEKLELPVYPRGDKRNEQIKMLEETRNIFKKADNSFTQINSEFKPQKQENHDNYVEENTLQVGNHSVYLGTRKYYFNRFQNMKGIFLSFIGKSESTSQKQYMEDFFQNCFYLNRYMHDESFAKSISHNKVKRIVHQIFMNQTYKIFNQMLSQTKYDILTFITYYGIDKSILDFNVCEKARKEVNKATKTKCYLSDKERSKYYAEINKLLTEWNEKPISYKETIYCLMSGTDCGKIDSKADMTRLYEILRYDIIRQLENITVYVPLGIARSERYQLNKVELEIAKAYVNEYVCYYDAQQQIKYYSEEDIA